MDDRKIVSTTMVIWCKLRKDDESLKVDQTMCRSMIGSLLYVIATIPNIIQVVGLVAKFQSVPKETHVLDVKRIFRYLKGIMEYGLCYPIGKDFTLIAFIDVD